MATNYDFAFANAMKKYEEAKTIEEKLSALDEMQRTQPSHKGAEKLRADLSKRISKLKEKQEAQARQRGGSKSMFFSKEGSATIVLIGLPNTGKSTLLSKITDAKPAISNYKFTTTEPELGIMDFKGVKIQVVELPAIIENSHKGKARGKEVLGLVRNADLVVYVLRGTKSEVENQVKILNSELSHTNIVLNKKKPQITLSKVGTKGIEIAGEKNVIGSIELLKQKMIEKGCYNVLLRVDEKLKVDEIVEGLDKSKHFLKALGIWVEGAGSSNKIIVNEIPVFSFTTVSHIKELLYNNLNLITIFTRKPGEKDSDNIPVALRQNGTVEDLCKLLHKDFIQKFKFARVWGSSKHAGQQVSLDFKFKAGDVVELYVRN